MKKWKIMALVGCLVISSVACSCKKKTTSDTNESVVTEEQSLTETADASETEATEIVETEESLSAMDELLGLMDTYKDSSWSGVDAAGNKYMVDFEGGLFTFFVENEEGEKVWNGDYQLDVDGVKLMAKENEDTLNQYLADAKCEYSVDPSNPYLKINDIYLSKDDFKDAQERLAALDFAAIAAKYMSSGHCWIAVTNEKAVVLYFDGQTIALRYMTFDGTDVQVEKIDADWALNGSNLSFFGNDGVNLDTLQWNFENEEALNVFNLRDENDELNFYELESESIEDGEEMAKIFLRNRKDVLEVEDLTTVLAGYEGVSIVDAFVMAGLDPSFENRAVCAGIFEIENYRGTAEQNLYLLQTMGGVVK